MAIGSIDEKLQRILASGGADIPRLNTALRLLAMYRSAVLQKEYIKRYGVDVLGGPFKGMHFLEHSAEGCHLPKLLGCYEQELQPFIAQIPARGFANIVNIGCAEGYYAVGFKRLFPAVRVLAFDTDENAQRACRTLAVRNQVDIEVGATFASADFQSMKGRTLVWCDIEGGERDLLDPEKAPALAHMDIVVELHPAPVTPDIAEVPKRFAATHRIQVIQQQMARPPLPTMFGRLGHLDQLLAVWEWRATPTPWAIMVANEPAD